MSEPTLFSHSAEQDSPGEHRAGAEAAIAQGLRSETAGVGQQLRVAREARNITLAEAAQSLKLGPRQVAALESEDWSSLPGNTMIRGFVRNYARLLGLDADALMRGLDSARLQQTLQLEASAGTSASLPRGGSPAERRDYLAVIGGLLLLVLALLAYFYFPADFWEKQLAELTGASTSSPVSVDPSKAAHEPAPAIVASSPAVAVESTAGTGTTSPALPAAAGPLSPALPSPAALPEKLANVASPAVPLAAQPGALPDSPSPAKAAGGGLTLRFAQAAWIEVRDGSGEVVTSGVKAANSQQEITGKPPFSLVLGNARYVTAEYQGKKIDLDEHITKGVARLTVK
ncbi:RodZ domain-containing protein [Accumulibacter sp.]|uniref:RodZ domain-containing protein n=1 Tax=Accumulibacter sp. TaxID=2053492 RepID=UPI0028C4BB13|nr:RodZ domain-containing protein [Accumulibacter sp.]